MSRLLTSATCRPPTGTRRSTQSIKLAKSAKSAKPAWALTQSEADEQLDLDVDQLMDFVQTLDFDSVMESVEDQIQRENEQKLIDSSISDQPIVETVDGLTSERLVCDTSTDQSLAEAINQHIDSSHIQSTSRISQTRPATAQQSTSRPVTSSTRPATSASRPATAQPVNQSNQLINTLKNTHQSIHTIHSTKSLNALLSNTSQSTNQSVNQSTVTLSTVKQQQAVVEKAQQKVDKAKAKQAADAIANAPDPATSLKQLPLDPSRLPYLRRCPAV